MPSARCRGEHTNILATMGAGVEHLAAALALWDYSEKSAMTIFGEMSGDPTVDRIMVALDEHREMTETDIARHDTIRWQGRC